MPHATVAVLQPQCSGCEECGITWQGQADHEGGVRFEFLPLPPGEYSSRIFAAKADGYAPSFRNEYEVRQGDETRFMFGLRPIVYRNTGTVLNDKGEPVTNAETGFFTGTVEACSSMSLYCPEFWGAHTEAEGRFSYGLPEKSRLNAYVLHPDYAREPAGSRDSWRGDVEFMWTPGQLAVMRDVYFEEGVTIEGRVVNGQSGEPIPGSHIRVGTWDTVQAGKDGTFRFCVQPEIVRLGLRAKIKGEWQRQHETLLYPKEGQDISGLEIVFNETAKP